MAPKQSSKAKKDLPGQEQLEPFVDQIEKRLESLDKTCRDRQLQCYLQADIAPLLDCEKKRADLLLNEDTWLTVMRWLNELPPSHPVWRRLVLLGRRLIPATVDCRPDVYELRHTLEKKYLDSPPRLGRKKLSWGQFASIIHTHPDREYRQQAWEALVPVADQLRAGFLELVRRRNYWAQQQGYATYIDVVLAPEGLSRDSVLENYVDLEEITLDSYKLVRGRMRDLAPSSCLALWDITYLPQARMALGDGSFTFSGGSPDVVALIKALGISWDSLHFAPDLTDRLPYPCTYWPVNIPEKVKLPISHEQGWTAYVEIARSFGQALLAGYTRQPTYFLKQPSPAYVAGMGAFVARVAADPTWVRRRQLLPESRRSRLEQISYDLLIMRLRYLMALSVFEYQVYETPEADLDAKWGEIQEAFLLLPKTAWSGWVAQPDYVLRPIHIQYEVIGEIIASQMVSYLQQRFGSLFGNPELTEFLEQSVYSSGAAHDWVDQVRVATGKFLSNKALFSELVGEE